jgi:outer membrane protein assembly factor BamD (BamD/ComL family)
MMKKLSYFMLLLLLAACSRPQEKLQKEITERESVFREQSNAQPNAEKADSLIGLYVNYADQYQDDTLSPEYLFRAGDLSIGIGKFTQAQELLGRVQRYPNYTKLPQVTFLQGFVAENHMGDTATARVHYEKFLDTFPDHPLAKDARAAIEHMGMSPEELIRQFEQNLQDSTVAAH